MRVLITGSCTWKDAQAIFTRLAHLTKEFGVAAKDITIIEGEAVGADLMARKAAEILGYNVEAHPPDYQKHGATADYVRNCEMAAASPDIGLAFWDGRSTGTFVTMLEAWKRNVPIDVTMAWDKSKVKVAA